MGELLFIQTKENKMKKLILIMIVSSVVNAGGILNARRRTRTQFNNNAGFQNSPTPGQFQNGYGSGNTTTPTIERTRKGFNINTYSNTGLYKGPIQETCIKDSFGYVRCD